MIKIIVIIRVDYYSKGYIIMSISKQRIELHHKYDMITNEALKLLANKKSRNYIQEKYGVTKNFFRYLERKNILQPKNEYKIKYSDSILVKAKDMYLEEGKSLTKIASILKINRNILSKDLKLKFNIEVLNDGKKQVNDFYFNIIDTPDKAYWLGFLYADGCNRGGKNIDRIEFCLQEKDKQSVIDFKEAINSKHKISLKKVVLNGKIFNNYRISIMSHQMSQDLIACGCIPNKTYSIDMPNNTIVPSNLYSHFIRGYFDGDGCVTAKKTGQSICVKFTSASYKFIVSLHNFFKENLDITGSISKVKNKDNYEYKMCSYGKTIKFYNYIYKNSNDKNRLLRKYKKFTNYINKINCRLRQKDVEKSEIMRAELNGKAKCDDNAYANPSPKANIVNLWDIINIHIPFNL